MKQPIYQPGTMIAGKYRIDKAIARGGCSIVYRGTHVGMHRELALKIMSLVDGRIDPSWQARFQREARLASQLRHPNTITIFDYGESEGIFYITMEWVEGSSLRNLIKAQGAMEPKKVAELTMQILRSLAEAHRQHILHRDMKPSNIMVTQDAEGEEMVKVLDFGLAKAQLGEELEGSLKLTRDGDFIGTPRYASPEQLRGQKLTRAADLYGVGMVMWEMLTGAPAVPAVDYGTCVQHHLGSDPWKLPPMTCPQGLAMIVERALAKTRSDRYQSCEEAIKDLKLWLREQSLPAFGSFGLHEDSEPLDVEVFDNTLDEIDALDPALVPAIFYEDDEDELPPIALIGGGGSQRTSSVEGSNAQTPHVSLGPKRPSRSVRHNHMEHMDELELELEDVASAPSRDPLVRGESELVSIYHTKSKHSSPALTRWIIGLALLIMIAMAVAYMMHLDHAKKNSSVEEKIGVGDRVLDSILSDKDILSDKNNTPWTDHKNHKVAHPKDSESIHIRAILVLLRQDGWSYGSSMNIQDIGKAKQSTLRLRKGTYVINTTLYECADSDFARELVTSTASSKEVVRLDRVVVRMASARKGSRLGVEKLTAALLNIQKSLKHKP